MTNYFNDSPIETPEDDQYGMLPFAASLAKSIRNIQSPIGTTIALSGAWGSGKSSTVNLIRGELEKAKDSTLVISDFKCWWYRGEEALALAFLQNLNAILNDTLADKVKDLVPNLGRGLLQAGPVVGAAAAFTPIGAWAAVTGAGLSFAKRFFPEGATVEKTFLELAKILEEEDRRFLIIIDDIDRLSPDEALAIFRLVKSVGRLPNVMYLLVFDRELAEKAVKERYPSEGPHFLEKIVQASFELPPPLRTDLNHAILTSIEKICGAPDETQVKRILNVFHDVVAPYLTTPRHVARFQNAISVTWPAIADEISLADFIALETIRLYEPSLFHKIRSNRAGLCGSRDRNDRGDPRDDERFSLFLRDVDEKNHDTAKLALQRLFPRLEEMGYGPEWRSSWDAERRICIEAHFDTYFRLSLSSEALSMERISELIERADDCEFIQKTFLEAATMKRRTGTSMVPVLLDELNTHAKKIEKDKVEPLLGALFEIHDDIDLDIDKDRGMMGMGNTTLRYHWLIRRLTEGYTLDEKSRLYMSTIKQASLGWLVDFVHSAKDDYSEKKDRPQREEDCLTREDVIPGFVDRALNAIRVASNDGSLLHHQDLISILFMWRGFLDGDVGEIRAWTDPLMDDDDALVIFAKAFTGESWSQGIGMFGLGDNVATRTIRAQIDENVDVIDLAAFRSGLERLQKGGTLSEEKQAIVDVFLDAWQRRRDGQDELSE